jgi:hypothetical protein
MKIMISLKSSKALSINSARVPLLDLNLTRACGESARMDGNTNRNSVCEGLDRPGMHIQNIRFGTCGRCVTWSARIVHNGGSARGYQGFREKLAARQPQLRTPSGPHIYASPCLE